MRQYQELLEQLLSAPVREDRTGTGTRGIFGANMQFDLLRGFPLLTTKKLHTKSIIHELLWMLSGSTNIKPLNDVGVTIWDEWADMDGDLGPVYGKQWRHWETGTAAGDYVDQIKDLIHGLANNPFSRRHVVSAWNPADIPDMKLPPCHCLFQFYVSEAGYYDRYAYFTGTMPLLKHDPEKIMKATREMDEAGVPNLSLHCQLYQRSADVFLGVPFNIASYALLTHLVAREVGMIPLKFKWVGGDVHLYRNHEEQAALQLAREVRPLPKLKILGDAGIFDVRYEDIVIEGYDPHPAIKAEVSV